MLLAMLTVDPEKRPRLKDVERMDWYLQCVHREPLRSRSNALFESSY
jgi:hypothetical protein